MRTYEEGIAHIKALSAGNVNIGANRCKERTRQAFDVASNGTATAYKSWLSIPATHQRKTTDPSQIPKNVFVYFSGGGKGSGHVGCTDETGAFWTPGGPSDTTHWYKTTVKAVLRSWGNLNLVGYSTMIDSRIPDRPSSAPVPPALRRPQPAPKSWLDFYHAPSNATWEGDSVRGVFRAAARARVGDPARALDINTPGCTRDNVWVAVHNPRPLLHGYVDTKKPTLPKNSLIAEVTFGDLQGVVARPGTRVPYPIRKLNALMAEADRLNVRVELEIKAFASKAQWLAFAADKHVKSLLKKGLLVVKTLAAIPGSVSRLTPAHQAGFPTMLSFTKYRGAGISAKRAWPVVTYTRGTPRWVA